MPPDRDEERAPSPELTKEAESTSASWRQVQLMRAVAGLPYEQQVQQLRPTAPLQFAVQMDGEDEEPLVMSLVPEGPARDAANELATSDEEIERNTAVGLAVGRIDVFYIDDLEHPDNEEDLLDGWGYDPAVCSLVLHPETGQRILSRHNMAGFWMPGTDDIFGRRADPVEEWKLTLLHETSHALNPPPSLTPLERYRSEFRAYWVVDFRDVEDPDERATLIKKHILRNYPILSGPYNDDEAVRTAIDGITRPDGNTTNDPFEPDWFWPG